MPAAKNHARVKLGSPRVGVSRAKPDVQQFELSHIEKLPETETLEDARHQNEGLRGRLLQIELALKEGRLVDRAEEDKRTFVLMRTTRDAIRAIPRRIAAEVHAADDVAGVQHILARELDDALRVLCDRLDAQEAAHVQ